MNNSRTLNNGISGLHKRALSLVYNDFSSSFPDLLEKDKSVTVHHRNLQTMAFEIFKAKNDMAPKILLEIFPQKEINYSLRNSVALQGRSIKLPGMPQKLYLVWDQKYGTFQGRNKKNCVSYIIQKENS